MPASTPAVADRYVLDTSAIFCLTEKEKGFEEVKELLREHESHASFASFMEFYYVNHQEFGEARAEELYQQLLQLPIQPVESDPPLGLLAGRIKAGFRLSFADAWVAATAERLNAVLVHKDPELDVLQDRLRMLRLPSKKA